MAYFNGNGATKVCNEWPMMIIILLPIPREIRIPVVLMYFHIVVISNASQGCKTYGWSKQERQEIWRRRLSLLMYLLRSPFYDRVTKWCIVFAFTSAKNMNIPFSSIAFEALMAYIPHYRRLYYYLWSK